MVADSQIRVQIRQSRHRVTPGHVLRTTWLATHELIGACRSPCEEYGCLVVMSSRAWALFGHQTEMHRLTFHVNARLLLNGVLTLLFVHRRHGLPLSRDACWLIQQGSCLCRKGVREELWCKRLEKFASGRLSVCAPCTHAAGSQQQRL